MAHFAKHSLRGTYHVSPSGRCYNQNGRGFIGSIYNGMAFLCWINTAVIKISAVLKLACTGTGSCARSNGLTVTNITKPFTFLCDLGGDARVYKIEK